MTRSAFFPENESREIWFPDTQSRSEKLGAGVPGGSMVDKVAVIFVLYHYPSIHMDKLAHIEALLQTSDIVSSMIRSLRGKDFGITQDGQTGYILIVSENGERNHRFFIPRT